jgi:4'-phosphopantetheinyl transferase
VIAELYANDGEPWPLRDGVVHVWKFGFAGEADPAGLSDEERAIAERFATRALRDTYVVQHVAVRALLAKYVAGPISFTRGARGKPHVAGIEHNLAHCDDVALLAVARDVAVGVDVERLDAAIDQRAVARIVRAPAEAALSFMRVWCRKEACLKATGVGLLDDLTSVSVAGERVEVAGEIVYVHDLELDGEHAAALATARQLVKSRMSCVERSAVIATSAVR